MTRTLIVNGDDFGLTTGVNAGIVHAHRQGILTSASLFANAGATGAAIRIAQQTPSLGVGVHVTLVDGRPMLPASTVPTLAPGGAFRSSPRALFAGLALGRVDLREVEREAAAQIEFLLDAGLTLTHLDTHKHVHAYQPVFYVIARLAVRYRIDVVRLPSEDLASARRARLGAVETARLMAEEAVLGRWSRVNRRRLDEAGLSPAPRFVGRALTGALTLNRFRAIVGALPDGVTELMVHPGYVDADLDAIRTRLRASRAAEVDVLIDPQAFEALARAGITLARHGAGKDEGRRSYG